MCPVMRSGFGSSVMKRTTKISKSNVFSQEGRLFNHLHQSCQMRGDSGRQHWGQGQVFPRLLNAPPLTVRPCTGHPPGMVPQEGLRGAGQPGIRQREKTLRERRSGLNPCTKEPGQPGPCLCRTPRLTLRGHTAMAGTADCCRGESALTQGPF